MVEYSLMNYVAMVSKPIAVTSVADLVYHACFDLGVPWHSEKSVVCIFTLNAYLTCKNIQLNILCLILIYLNGGYEIENTSHSSLQKL